MDGRCNCGLKTQNETEQKTACTELDFIIWEKRESACQTVRHRQKKEKKFSADAVSALPSGAAQCSCKRWPAGEGSWRASNDVRANWDHACSVVDSTCRRRPSGGTPIVTLPLPASRWVPFTSATPFCWATVEMQISWAALIGRQSVSCAAAFRTSAVIFWSARNNTSARHSVWSWSHRQRGEIEASSVRQLDFVHWQLGNILNSYLKCFPCGTLTSYVLFVWLFKTMSCLVQVVGSLMVISLCSSFAFLPPQDRLVVIYGAFVVQ